MMMIVLVRSLLEQCFSKGGEWFKLWVVLLGVDGAVVVIPHSLLYMVHGDMMSQRLLRVVLVMTVMTARRWRRQPVYSLS